MLKTIVAGAVALTIVGAGLALAQPTRGEAPHARPSAEDFAAFTEARIAALKAGLKLTAEQEKNWPAVEAAMRDLAKERADRMAAWREARQSGDDAARRADIIERLRRGADTMGTRAAALKQLADAAEPLYKSLDDAQKRRFSMLLHMGGRPHGYGHGYGHRHGHWERRAEHAR